MDYYTATKLKEWDLHTLLDVFKGNLTIFKYSSIY